MDDKGVLVAALVAAEPQGGQALFPFLRPRCFLRGLRLGFRRGFRGRGGFRGGLPLRLCRRSFFSGRSSRAVPGGGRRPGRRRCRRLPWFGGGGGSMDQREARLIRSEER